MFPDLLTDDAFRLETRSLWLRWPRLGDAAAISKHAGEPAVSRYTARISHPYSQADAEAFVLGCRKENALGRQCALALTLKGKPGSVIGMIGVHPGVRDEAKLGYWLAEPFWGRGLMGEALDEILAFTFTASQASRVSAVVRKENIASHHLLASRRFLAVEDLLVNMPLRNGVFACAKYELEQEGWRKYEAERFSRVPHQRAKLPAAAVASRKEGATKLCA